MKAFFLFVLFPLFCSVYSRIGDQYCGDDNCYEVLNVTKDATPAEIKKSYRALSLKYHPDKNLDTDTTEIYREINRAYEILSNEELRKTYDEYLENPGQNEYYQYYKFYKAKYSPQVDPRLVVGLFVTLYSIFQYVSRRTMYNGAVAYVERTTKFQTMVNQRLEEERARNSNMTRDAIIAELRRTVQIHGGYSLPKITDVLFFQIIFLPYTIAKGLYSSMRWLILFNILRRPYGPVEREILTRKKLNLNEKKWMMIPEEQRVALIRLELWVRENYKQYLKDMKEREREQYAESGKYKQYQRFMKNKKYR